MDTYTLESMLNYRYFATSAVQNANQVMAMNLLVLSIDWSTNWRKEHTITPGPTIMAISELPRGYAQSEAVAQILNPLIEKTPYGYLFQNMMTTYLEFEFDNVRTQQLLADSLQTVAKLDSFVPAIEQLAAWLTTYTNYLVAHGETNALLIPTVVKNRLQALFAPLTADIKNMYLHGIDNIDVPFLFGNPTTKFYLAHQADPVLELFASLSQFLHQMPLSQMLPITDVDFEVQGAQLPVFDALLVRLIHVPILETDQDEADKATLMNIAKHYFDVEAIMLTMIAANALDAKQIVVMAQVNPQRDYLWQRFWQKLKALPDLNLAFEAFPLGVIADTEVEYRLVTITSTQR
ncbi:hypothetical protein [Periweissella fabalis]|uniref:Uncharacterized protein n=1 Tax=Periweissella fabalis TaxID=1070421 RepID=A0A7X6N1H7_9LACO|nr:hypothetical protein [Periweissella fabalis]MCM0599091.1 hypothetical protein [Periweissella fabalis]NKZ23370.1 hypothetical protein [Periweissella fabalis]